MIIRGVITSPPEIIKGARAIKVADTTLSLHTRRYTPIEHVV